MEVDIDIKSGLDVPEIRTYLDAFNHYESKGDEKSRQNGDRFLAGSRYSNRTMRELDDGSISIRYFDEHMITYRPDGTIDVSGASTKRNSDPSQQVFPKGLFWDINSRIGPIVISCPSTATVVRWWQIRNDKAAFSKCLIMRGHPDSPVHMRLVDKRWEPANPDQLTPFVWTEFDRDAARGIGTRQGLPDFVAALDAYIGLGVELPEFEKGVAMSTLLGRLRAKDFRGVMAGLSRYKKYTWSNPHMIEEIRIRESAIRELRTQAIVEAGLTFMKSQKILTATEFRTVENRLKRFGKAKVR